MAQVMNFTFEEVTLGLFELQTCNFQLLKDNFNVFKMLLWSSTEDDDIIQVRHRTKSLQSCKTIEINYWKYAGACAKPNGTELNSYFPKGVTKAVFALDSSLRFM